MENIIPKCIKNNICSHLCNVKTCKAIPFLCIDQQCSCHSQHQKCITTLKWKGMRQSFSNKLKKSPQIIKYFTDIDNLYKSTLKQIEVSYSNFKNISENFGANQLSQLQREVYQKLREKKFTELNGQLINKVQKELMQQKKQYQARILDIENKQIEKQTTILIKMMEELGKLASFKLDSKITRDTYTLSTFFPNKKILSMDLLYRASDNNFQVSKFWDKCNGRKHTLTIIKTEFGNRRIYTNSMEQEQNWFFCQLLSRQQYVIIYILTDQQAQTNINQRKIAVCYSILLRILIQQLYRALKLYLYYFIIILSIIGKVKLF